MKNLFDKNTCEEIIRRINTLTPESQRQWGIGVKTVLNRQTPEPTVSSACLLLLPTYFLFLKNKNEALYYPLRFYKMQKLVW